MALYIVSVYDKAAEAFGRPAFVTAKGLALRSFIDEVNRKPSEGMPNAMNVYPQDYALYHLGMYDDVQGRFESLDVPERLLEASAVHTGS